MNLRERRAIETQLDAASQTCARQGGQLTPLRRQVLGLILEAVFGPASR